MAAAAANGQTVFITGASRGIGLGLAETYAKKGFRVIAAARNPAKADKLQALLKAHKSVQTVTLDVADSKSVAGLAAQLNALQPAVTAIDLVYNNAGIFTAGVLTPLETSTVDDWINVYRTNVVGTWEVTQKLLPFVRKSKAAKIVNLSSSLGSVSETNAGPIPGLAASYRSSKAALNELSAVQAREYNLATVSAKPEAKAAAAPLITVIALNPGWVDTDMGNGGGTLKPPLTLEQSVTGIEKAISGAPVSAIASYIDYEGKKVEW